MTDSKHSLTERIKIKMNGKIKLSNEIMSFLRVEGGGDVYLVCDGRCIILSNPADRNKSEPSDLELRKHISCSVKIARNGNITIPSEVSDLLHLFVGDKLTPIRERDAILLTENAPVCALRIVQQAMKGEAEKRKIKEGSDAIDLVMKLRYKEKEKKDENID
ncbi:MAG: AbrB/MazE/SpoVT family DNA-binding domain-containing protein [Christensenellaceae bacterium]|jgi:bifunctional DNA-binding transcriptional regulator/antitoxin component of YhaV-PrlF toxin-antitoxin module|nr:AbrB/MazE/SpoVT family DNA-binding domain-containing protein [Christensenellaceae bacterium]